MLDCTHFLRGILLPHQLIVKAYPRLYSKEDRITGSGYFTKWEETQVAWNGNLKSLKRDAQR